jgi:Phage-related protein, tail component
MLYSERYEAETVTFTTSLDAGVVVRPGQIIKISDPLRSDLRRGGRIVSATTTAITVDDARGNTNGISQQADERRHARWHVGTAHRF